MCGEMSAGKPNENHKTFQGHCSTDLKCIENKCGKAGEKSAKISRVRIRIDFCY